MDPEWTGDEITCEVAWILIQGFVSGESTADGERAMRAHTERCGDCRDEYRSAVVTAAKIGGEQRRKRVAAERERRHRELRQAAFEASAPPTGRFHRLRTLLYPAFFAFLMFQISRLSLAVEGVEVTRLEGEVSAAQVPLEGTAARRLARGEWCETRTDSSARLATSGCSAVLGPDARLRVERAMPARFRLTRGTLDLEGECTVSTGWGILDLGPGKARVRVDDGTLEVASRAGDVQLTGAAGAQRIAPGEVLRRGP